MTRRIPGPRAGVVRAPLASSRRPGRNRKERSHGSSPA